MDGGFLASAERREAAPEEEEAGPLKILVAHFRTAMRIVHEVCATRSQNACRLSRLAETVNGACTVACSFAKRATGETDSVIQKYPQKYNIFSQQFYL